MTGWPPIEQPELLQRLAMDDAAFEVFFDDLFASFPPRELEADALERALDYPWGRPEGSFRLIDGAVDELDAMEADERTAVRQRFVSDPSRYPMLAFGANSSPEGLERKFAHFTDPEDRTTLVLSGWLHDFDVGASAQPTVYGSMPATLFPSPGTAVRAALISVTANQFTQLAWSEISYSLGKLRTRFELDPGSAGGDDAQVDEVLAFVSRFGAFHRGAGPVALAAVPARGRTAEALTQEALLHIAAELCLGPGATAEDLVRSAFEDLGVAARRAAATIRPQSIPFASNLWTPFPVRDLAARD